VDLALFNSKDRNKAKQELAEEVVDDIYKPTEVD